MYVQLSSGKYLLSLCLNMLMGIATALARLHVCAGLSERSLLSLVTRTNVQSLVGSFNFTHSIFLSLINIAGSLLFYSSTEGLFIQHVCYI